MFCLAGNSNFFFLRSFFLVEAALTKNGEGGSNFWLTSYGRTSVDQIVTKSMS